MPEIVIAEGQAYLSVKDDANNLFSYKLHDGRGGVISLSILSAMSLTKDDMPTFVDVNALVVAMDTDTVTVAQFTQAVSQKADTDFVKKANQEKLNKSTYNDLLKQVAFRTDVNAALSLKADQGEMEVALGTKVDASHVYTREEVLDILMKFAMARVVANINERNSLEYGCYPFVWVLNASDDEDAKSPACYKWNKNHWVYLGSFKDFAGGGSGEDENAFHWKGYVETVNDLPSQKQAGDVWHVNADDGEYYWGGNRWEAFGPFIARCTCEEKLGAGVTVTNTATQQFKELNDLIELLDGTLSAKIDTDISAVKTELNGNISTAKSDLESQISTLRNESISGDSTLNGKITTVKAELDATISTTKEELAGQISDAKSTLNGKIDTVGSTLDSKIDSSVVTLNTSIGTVKSELNTSISTVKTELNTVIISVKSELNTTVDSVKTELNTTIDSAKSELNTKIDTVESQLDARVTALEDELGLSKQILTGIMNDHFTVEE